jgi:hypothetical protein
MRRRSRLRLVGSTDPADVFNDLKSLQTEQQTPARRKRSAETFARIPHDRGLELYKHRLSAAAYTVLIELDRLILKAGGRNPVKFSSRRLRALGLKEQYRSRALRHLAAVGVISITHRGHGLSPWVTHSSPTVSPRTSPTVSPRTLISVSQDTPFLFSVSLTCLCFLSPSSK